MTYFICSASATHGHLWPSPYMAFLKSHKIIPLLRFRGQKRQGAKLQTATSSGDVYSMISLQRLEQWMVPKFC